MLEKKCNHLKSRQNCGRILKLQVSNFPSGSVQKTEKKNCEPLAFGNIASSTQELAYDFLCMFFYFYDEKCFVGVFNCTCKAF